MCQLSPTLSWAPAPTQRVTQAADATKEVFHHLTHTRPEPFQAQNQKGEPSHAHQADSGRECCSTSGSLLLPPDGSQKGFPCASGRPSLSGGGRQCTLCHKTLSEAKLFRQGGKLWNDSLPGWAAAAGRLPPLLFPFFPGVGSQPRWEPALLLSRLPAGARLKQGKTERPHGL